MPYFEQVAGSYFDRYREDSPGGYALRIRKQRVLELLDGVQGKVLDVGCGPGVMVRELLDRGFEVWAVDAAAQMVGECRKNFGHLSRVHSSIGSATALDFPEGFFDAVLCMGVVDHVRDCDLAVAEMSRVLRSGGVLIVTLPNRLSPYGSWKNYVFYPLMRFARSAYQRWAGGSPRSSLGSRARLHRRAAVARLLSARCGQVTDVRHFYVNLLLSPLDELFPRVAARFSQQLEPLCNGRFRWLAAGFIFKVRKRDDAAA